MKFIATKKNYIWNIHYPLIYIPLKWKNFNSVLWLKNHAESSCVPIHMYARAHFMYEAWIIGYFVFAKVREQMVKLGNFYFCQSIIMEYYYFLHEHYAFKIFITIEYWMN